MPVDFTLYNDDGTINLDLTTKVLRWKYWETAKYDKAPATSTFIVNPFTGAARDTFYLQDDSPSAQWTVTGSAGTRPSEALRLRTGLVDNVVYVITPGSTFLGAGATSNSALFKDYYATESWPSSEGSAKDMLQIFSATGELMWSQSTLFDAIIFNASLMFNSVGSPQTYNSPRGRRLYINVDNIFSSPSMNETTTSNSGVVARWRNAGTAVDVAYFSYYDLDVGKAMRAAGALAVDIYEIIGE